MTPVPDGDLVRALRVEAVELGARMLYAAYMTHRNLVEGDNLQDWAHLCERKRERFRAQARAIRTFLGLTIGDDPVP